MTEKPTNMKLVNTYTDLAKYTLWADSPVDSSKPARLTISFRDGNPRFVVNTGAKGRDGMINFPMTISDMTAILNMFKDVAKGEKNSLISVRSVGYAYVNNKRTDELKDLARLHIGKSAEGVCFISLTTEDKPKIVFPIKPSKFMVYMDRNKVEMDTGYVSERMTVGMCDLLLDVCADLMMHYTKETYANGSRVASEIIGNDSTGRPVKPQPPKQAANFDDLDDIQL